MKYYFAPLEGNTGYVYRNAHHRFFPGIDKYYTPFVAPNHTLHFKTKEKEDVDPANNAGVPLVPQILSNNVEETLWAIRELAELGYGEINLNIGCPVPTIARKKKGSGLLKYTDLLDAYLEGVFECALSGSAGIRISVKTRLGTDSTEEAEGLIELYNRYPISELTVHPRSQKDLYRGEPDLEAFRLVLGRSRNPIVFNGNLFSAEPVRCFQAMFPQVDSVMIGRGLLADPALVRVCRGGEPLTVSELRAFHDALYEGYRETLPGSAVVIGRMKEFWHYTGTLFPEGARALKEIRKARDPGSYEAAVRVLLGNVPLTGEYRGE